MWLEQDISSVEPPAAPALNETPHAHVEAQLDPSVVRMLAILELLYKAQQQGRASVSFAVICKRLALRMSTVQRLMTALQAQQLVALTQEEARWLAHLTAAGMAISQALPSA